MRQVVGLLRVIGKSDLVAFYNQILSYKAAGAEKLPSLEEFLTLASGSKPQPTQVFDQETDKKLEAEALRRFEERQKRIGR